MSNWSSLPSKDVATKTVQFAAGTYDFIDVASQIDSDWSLLGAPLRLGKITTHLDGRYSSSIFQFNNTNSDCIFAGVERLCFDNANKTTGNGAALYTNYISGPVLDSEFTSNVNSAGNGAAIYAYRDFLGDIERVLFGSNTAQNNGGAMNVKNFDNKRMKHVTFELNEAGVHGGAIYMREAFKCDDMNDVTFTYNTAAAGRGGAIYASGEFSGTMNDVTFTWNIAGGRGGAIYANNMFNANMNKSEFSYNDAGGDGGAIYASGGFSGTMDDVTFILNDAITGSGGAIYASNTFNANMNKSKFSCNDAGGDGGAIYASGGFSGTMNDVTFTWNIAGGSGGAVAVSGSWECQRDALDAYATSQGSNNGDTLFLRNGATDGGAIYIGKSANIYAAFGDTIFQGNLCSYDADSESGISNAIYFGNVDDGATVTLSAFDNYVMRFYDPISSNVAYPNLAIRINGATESPSGGDPEIDNLGQWAARQTGTILFDKHQSEMNFADATVSNGTIALHNGAIFGADSNMNTGRNSTFTLNHEATLRIAYAQEQRTYKLEEEDGTFNKNNPSRVIAGFLAYGDTSISAINAKTLNLHGTLHFVIPSNVTVDDVLFSTQGEVIFDADTTRIRLDVAKGGLPLEIDDNIVLLKAAKISGNIAKKTVPAHLIEHPAFGVTVTESYLFDISINDTDLIATLAIDERLKRCIEDTEKNRKTALKAHKRINDLEDDVNILKDKAVVSPSMQALTNSYLAGLLLVNYGEETTATLVRGEFLPLCCCRNSQKTAVKWSSRALARNCEACQGDACAEKKLLWRPFLVPCSADRSTYETGTDASLKSRACIFSGGVLAESQLTIGQLRFGEFFDCGIERYSSENGAASNEYAEDEYAAEKIAGQGHCHSYVLGTVLRMDFDASSRGHAYWEGSCRLGGLAGDWESADLVDGERRADHKISNFICGGHLAIGYKVMKSSALACDFAAKCLWSHRSGGQVQLNDDAVTFDAVDSTRLHLGVGVSSAKWKNFSLSLAAALERELDGKSQATVCGYPLPISSLRGNSATGELQLTWRPSGPSNLAVDLGLKGYAGTREGISCHLQISKAL
ncbi:MAG: hypothetical protein LBC42_01530 [Puniceicoccales bacterium]|nr:hypothetical protein [Puniceicoccales bacterium]